MGWIVEKKNYYYVSEVDYYIEEENLNLIFFNYLISIFVTLNFLIINIII